MFNFEVTACDTDSIFFKKPDGTFFSKEERIELLRSINDLLPSRIRFEDNGFYPKIICLKAKNYIMQTEDGSIKYKGSAIKATTKEVALQEFIKEVIGSILEGKQDYEEIYQKYVCEILNVKDIKRWASKKTITEKVLESARTNESKVRDAIEESDYAEGDKVYVYFDIDNNLKLVENYNNDYNKIRLLKKLYQTSKVFVTIINKEIFTNYSLVKNQKLLESKP